MNGARPFPWRAYSAYFREHAGSLAAITAAGVVQSFANLPLAWLIRKIFDEILPARNYGALWVAIAELAGLQAGTLFLAYAIRSTALRVNQNVLASLRRRSLERLYELPRSFYTDADLDRLHVVLVHETTWIELMNNALTVQFLPAALSASVLFAILLWIEPRYAPVLAIGAPVLLAANRVMRRRAWFRMDAVRRAFEAVSAGVRFVLSAIDLTRAQAAESLELKRQNGLIDRLERLSVDLSRADTTQQVVQRSLLLGGVLAILLAGGYAVSEGRITRGEMMAFFVVATLFATQAQTMVAAVPEIRLGMRAFSQLHDLLTQPQREPYQGRAQVARLGTIHVEGATFSYGAAPPVLDAATLEVPPGRRVGLIGPNGSGKTTLAYLIAGYYRPRTGRLTADGIPYDDLDIRGLRAHMAIVSQSPFLFSDTIRANLTYGLESLDATAIREALERAGATAWTDSLPEGLDTYIGENGVRLSGGQRQRLVIARALLRRPDLLILDEPSTHLDDEAIELLMDTMQRLPSQPSILLITHELRLLRLVHQAYRLTDGRIEKVTPLAAS